MKKTDYKKRYRLNSFILNPKGSFGANINFLNTNSRKDIDAYIVRLVGSEAKKDHCYNPETRTWDLATIPSLENELFDQRETFKEYEHKRVSEGFARPTEMPPDATDRAAQIEAHLVVAKEEREFLFKARENAPEPIEERQEVSPRRLWAAGKLRHGELVERGGFTVSKNADGVPCIADDRSQHNGMENWRFIDQIIKPMEWENMHRQKIEREASNKENRPYKKPAYPEAGIWHKDSDVIEYPEYSARTIEQIKTLI